MAKYMALIGKLGKGYQRVINRLGYGRVWLQSWLFPVHKGRFPPIRMAVKSAYPPQWRVGDRPHGLLAVGGRLTEETLLAAYAQGVYPFCDQDPIRWVVFNPRMVLFPGKAKLGRGVRGIIRSGRYKVTFDTAFEEVVRCCSNREYTWIVPARVKVALALHQKGRAHSVEVWNTDGCLVGGSFGVDMGRVFIGESAFSKESDAMKVGFAYLNCHLQLWGYELHDAQIYGRHLELMGFEEIPPAYFLERMRALVDKDLRLGPWKVDERLDVAQWHPSVPGGSQLRKERGA